MNNNFSELEKFNIADLDNAAQEVFNTVINRLTSLRLKRQSLPDKVYNLKTDFDIEYCRAQTDICKFAIIHLAKEAHKNAKENVEIAMVKNWQHRRLMKENFIKEQRKLKQPLPWKYDFFGNLFNVIKSVLFFIPSFLLHLFIRKPKIADECVKSKIKPTDAPTPAPKLLLPYTAPAPREPASADVEPVGNKPMDKESKPKPTPASQSAKVSVSRCSLIDNGGKQ